MGHGDGRGRADRGELGPVHLRRAIGHVVEIALGYYIGPLVNVVLGVLVLRERPRPLQWVALVIATAAVVVIASATGACRGSGWAWP